MKAAMPGKYVNGIDRLLAPVRIEHPRTAHSLRLCANGNIRFVREMTEDERRWVDPANYVALPKKGTA